MLFFFNSYTFSRSWSRKHYFLISQHFNSYNRTNWIKPTSLYRVLLALAYQLIVKQNQNHILDLTCCKIVWINISKLQKKLKIGKFLKKKTYIAKKSKLHYITKLHYKITVQACIKSKLRKKQRLWKQYIPKNKDTETYTDFRRTSNQLRKSFKEKEINISDQAKTNPKSFC